MNTSLSSHCKAIQKGSRSDWRTVDFSVYETKTPLAELMESRPLIICKTN